MTDEVELTAAEQQVVRVDLARLLLVAADRVVVEDDRLAAEDRRLDLREPLRQLAPAGSCGDGHPHGRLVRSAERGRLAPAQLLQREPERLRIRELPVEQVQRRAQGRELLVGELDRRQVEVL